MTQVNKPSVRITTGRDNSNQQRPQDDVEDSPAAATPRPATPAPVVDAGKQCWRPPSPPRVDDPPLQEHFEFRRHVLFGLLLASRTGVI